MAETHSLGDSRPNRPFKFLVLVSGTSSVTVCDWNVWSPNCHSLARPLCSLQNR